MAVLAVVPVRGGSKGVPRKNVKNLGGKPLVAHVLETLKQVQGVDHVIMSTDDTELMKVGRDCGVDVPFERPPELAKGTSPLVAVNKHALDFFAEQGTVYDAVISVQATCPFLRAESLQKAVDVWKETGCDSVSSMVEVTDSHPDIFKRLAEDSRIEPFWGFPTQTEVRRQDRTPAYRFTGGFYLRSADLLNRIEPKGRALGDDARGVAVSEYEAVDINTVMDFHFAEFLVQSGLV